MATTPAVNAPYTPTSSRSSRPGGAIPAGSGIQGTIELRGGDALAEALGALPKAIENKILARAMRNAATPILDAAKRNAPVLTGQLRKSLKIRSLKRNNKGQVGVVISTAKGFFKGETFYGAFIEFGTKKLPARPFIRPAFESNKARAVKIVGEAIKLGLEDVAQGASKASEFRQLKNERAALFDPNVDQGDAP